jgi:hypothetical protein
MENISNIHGSNTLVIDKSKNELRSDDKKILGQFTDFLSEQEKNYQTINNPISAVVFFTKAKEHITLINDMENALNLFKNYPKVFSLFNIQEKNQPILDGFLLLAEDPNNEELKESFTTMLFAWKDEANKSNILDLARKLQNITKISHDSELVNGLMWLLRGRWDELNEVEGENIELDSILNDIKFNPEIDSEEKDPLIQEDTSALNKKLEQLNNKILITYNTLIERSIKTGVNPELEVEVDNLYKNTYMHIKNDQNENQLLLDLKTMKEIYKGTLRENDIQHFQDHIEFKIKQLNEEREIDETYLINKKKLKLYKSKIKQLDSIEGAYTYTTNTVNIKKLIPIGNYIGGGEWGSVNKHGTNSEWVVKTGKNLFREYRISKLLGDNTSFVKLHRLYVNETDNNEDHIIVMDYVRGKTLMTIITSKSHIDITLTQDLLVQLTSIVGYLFEKKVSFDDVNAGNIILTEENKLVLIDFGTWSQENDGSKRGEALLKESMQIMESILWSGGLQTKERAELLHPKDFFTQDFDYNEYVNSYTGYTDSLHAAKHIIETNEEFTKDPLNFINSYINAVIENVKTYSK